ncbi:hypothetical protein ACRAWF_32055 [Streptomyces sp. L7]
MSLILVTGQSPSNTNPPSAAMLAWAVGQAGLALLVAPVLRRLLERAQLWRRVRPLGGASMTLYLWHMLPVLIVAGAFLSHRARARTGLWVRELVGCCGCRGWWCSRSCWWGS